MSATIDSLQIGMHWFGERPGGLDRMFMALVDALPAQGVNVRGLVAGSPAVLDASGGRVHPFAATQDGLGKRLWQVRTRSRELTTARMPDVVATHFALYAAPTVGVSAVLGGEVDVPYNAAPTASRSDDRRLSALVS